MGCLQNRKTKQNTKSLYIWVFIENIFTQNFHAEYEIKLPKEDKAQISEIQYNH